MKRKVPVSFFHNGLNFLRAYNKIPLFLEIHQSNPLGRSSHHPNVTHRNAYRLASARHQNNPILIRNAQGSYNLTVSLGSDNRTHTHPTSVRLSKIIHLGTLAKPIFTDH